MNIYYGSFQKFSITKPVSIMDIARFADRFGIITAEDVETGNKITFYKYRGERRVMLNYVDTTMGEIEKYHSEKKLYDLTIDTTVLLKNAHIEETICGLQ